MERKSVTLSTVRKVETLFLEKEGPFSKNDIRKRLNIDYFSLLIVLDYLLEKNVLARKGKGYKLK